MKKKMNKDVPVESVLKQVLIENGKLKSEIDYLNNELQAKNRAIEAFKIWQGKVAKRSIQYWLVDHVNLLNEPLSDEAVNILRRLLGNKDSYKRKLKSLVKSYENYLKYYNQAKDSVEITNFVNN